MTAARAVAPHHSINGLRFVIPLAERPDYIAKDRPRGLKAKGIAYERQAGKALRKIFPGLVSSQWFRYIDISGPGVCQTDHYAVLGSQVLLFECKLAETWVGFSQIDFLYRPILRQLYGLPVTGVMVCKYITTRDNPRLIQYPDEALNSPGENHVWHFMGK